MRIRQNRVRIVEPFGQTAGSGKRPLERPQELVAPAEGRIRRFVCDMYFYLSRLRMPGQADAETARPCRLSLTQKSARRKPVRKRFRWTTGKFVLRSSAEVFVKILLLSVPSEGSFYDQVVIPFGLASLGTYAKLFGHEVKGVEMNAPRERIPLRYMQADPEIVAEIEAFAPDIAAMTTYSENIHNVLFWAGKLKELTPSIFVALGGNHASYIAKEILADRKEVDFVIRFEGEIGFKALLDQLEGGTPDFGAVPNLTYRENGAIRENAAAPPIMNFDELPLIDRDIFESSPEQRAKTHADVITARGCPFHCTFCNCNHYWGKKYRTYSIPRVIEELTSLKKKYARLESVRFRDETISVQKSRCLELCAALRELNPGLRFEAHSRLDGLDEEVISALAAAGFKRLFIGLESGSRRVLERLKKGIRLEHAATVFPALRKAGIEYRCSFILGTPGETPADLRDTLRFIGDSRFELDDFYFNEALIIYPGTTESTFFREAFPDYRWLRKRELGKGYSQIPDAFGNPVSVRCFQAGYAPTEIDAAVSRALAPLLAPQFEDEYSAYRKHIRRLSNRLGRKDRSAFREAIRALLAEIDKFGRPWALCIDNLLSKHSFEELRDASSFVNYVGTVKLVRQDMRHDEREKAVLYAAKILVVDTPVETAAYSRVLAHFSANADFDGTIVNLDAALERGATGVRIDDEYVAKNSLALPPIRTRRLNGLLRRYVVRPLKIVGLHRPLKKLLGRR